MKKALHLILATLVLVCTLAMFVSADPLYPPIEIRFDGDTDALTLAAMTYDKAMTGEVKDGRLVLTTTAQDACNVSLRLNQSDYFALYDYPYVKYKFKTPYDAHHSQLYLHTNTAADTSKFGYNFYHQINNSIKNKDKNMSYIVPVTGFTALSGAAYPSASNTSLLDFVRFDAVRTPATGGTVELEYIAFFHTLEEAEAYGNTPTEFLSALSAKDWGYKKDAATDAAALKTLIEADIALLAQQLGISNVTSTVTVSESDFAPGEENAKGSFKFTVSVKAYKSVADVVSFEGTLLPKNFVADATISSDRTTVEAGGATIDLSVKVDGAAGITAYKWYRSDENSADIASAELINTTTAAELDLIASPAAVGDYYYFVVVDCDGDDVVSNVIKVTSVKPETLVMDFTNKDFVANVGPQNLVLDPETGKIPVVTKDGETYAHLETETKGVLRFYYDFTENERISLEAHPYFVIKMRRTFAGSFNTYLKTTFYDLFPDKQYPWFAGMHYNGANLSTTANTWTINVVNMPEFLETYETQIGPTHAMSKHTWNGYLKHYMLQVSSVEAGNSADVEFIAFASSMEDVAKLLVDRTVSALDSYNFSARQSEVEDESYKADIAAAIAEAAARYNVTVGSVTCSDVVEATPGVDGSFKFSVTLSYGEDYSDTYEGAGVIKSAAVGIAGEEKVVLGKNASLTVEADGIVPTSYEWLYGTTDSIEAATSAGTNATLTKNILTIGAHYFFVKVTGTVAGSETPVTLISDAFKVECTAPAEPIIWRLNNEDVIDLWDSGKKSFSSKKSVLKDGVMYTEFDTGALVDDHYFLSDGTTDTIPAAKQFYLDAYPYVKIKYRQNGARTMQLYFWADKNVQELRDASSPDLNPRYDVGAPAKDAWTTVSIDFSTNKAMNRGNYTGKLYNMGIWLWNDNGVGSSEIEYIAFFPATAEGKAAWEAFDSATPTVQCSSEAYLPNYAVVNDVYTAVRAELETIHPEITTASAAESLVSALIIEKLGDKVDDVVYDDISTAIATEQGFKVNVTIGMGEACENRTMLTETFEVKTKTPPPMIWKFNNPEFVDKFYASGSVTIAFAQQGNESYIDVNSLGAADNCNFAWYIPEENRFELSDYPYVAIRYRSTHGGTIQFYPSITTTADGASGSLYRPMSMDSKTGEWTKIVRPLTGGAGEWKGIIDYIRLDFMRYASVKKDIDIDYIAFFSTQAEAEAYNGEVLGDKAKTDAAKALINEDVFGTVYGGVSNNDEVKAQIEKLIGELELPEGVRTYVTTSTVEGTDPTLADGMVGKCNYRIYFLHGKSGASAVTIYDGLLPLAPNPAIYMLGAQIRNDAPKGLRFGTKISSALTKDVDVTNVSYGTVVIPTNLIPAGEELTLATAGAADVKGRNIFSQTDDELIYTAVVHDVPANEEERLISARAYVKYTFDGEEFTIYSNTTKSTSINAVEGLAQNGYEDEPRLQGVQTYDTATWVKPFWDGNIVYHELFWPVLPDGASENADLVVDLMYPISDVLSLKNGTNTIDYIEGKDFYVNENGQLVIPASSAIKRTPFNFYISDTNADGLHGQTVTGSGNIFDDSNGRYNGKKLYYTEGAIIQENYQYSISYRHTSTWTGLKPETEYNATVFPITRQKLANKENFTIGFYGDSITAGGNQTGSFGVSPYTPKWSQMIVDELERLYGYTGENGIVIENRAQGGRNTNWGAHNNNASPNSYAKEQFANTNPTLFVLAFGMNEESLAVSTFKANIISIIEQILTINPNCEFLLVSNSLPNPLWGSTAHRFYLEDTLGEVVNEMTAKGVSIDCAKLQSMHKYLLGIKEYRDMSGNNVNHQNDMLSRLYAQTCLAYITNLYNAD